MHTISDLNASHHSTGEADEGGARGSIIQRSQGKSWLETLQKKSTPRWANTLPQAEALGYDASGRFISVTPEGANPELQKRPMPADLAP